MQSLLDGARASGVAALEAKALLVHALGVPRTWLITHAQDALSAQQFAAARDAITRRAAGEPVAYIIGEREFFGLRFRVSDAVLIPRPETEHLVEFAVKHAPHGATVADIGCGSGAIAIALAHARPDLRVIATDISAAALAIAQINAQQLGVAQRVSFAQGDLLAPLADLSCAVIVSNPPYIAANDPHLAQGDLRFEPASALTDGADGLALLRQITAGAQRCLISGGWLAVEHGYDQAAAVTTLFHAAGLSHVSSTADLAGILRNTLGQKHLEPRTNPYPSQRQCL